MKIQIPEKTDIPEFVNRVLQEHPDETWILVLGYDGGQRTMMSTGLPACSMLFIILDIPSYLTTETMDELSAKYGRGRTLPLFRVPSHEAVKPIPADTLQTSYMSMPRYSIRFDRIRIPRVTMSIPRVGAYTPFTA